MDIRKSLEIMRNLGDESDTADHRHQAYRMLQEGEGDMVSDQELQEEIKKFQDEVVFAPAETFKPLAKGDGAIHWAGTVEGVVEWSYYVTLNQDKSYVSIKLSEATELTEHMLEVFNNLKYYYDKFYEYWAQEI